MDGCRGEQAGVHCSCINIIKCDQGLFLLIYLLNLNILFQYISLSLFLLILALALVYYLSLSLTNVPFFVINSDLTSSF